MTFSQTPLAAQLPPTDVMDSIIANYMRHGPRDQIAVQQLRQIRQTLITWVAAQDEKTLSSLWFDQLKTYSGLMITSEFSLEPLNADEIRILDQVSGLVLRDGMPPIQAVIIMMWLCPAYRAPMVDLDAVPPWFLRDFVFYITQCFKLVRTPSCLQALEHNCTRYTNQINMYRTRRNPRHNPANVYYEYLLYLSPVNLYPGMAASNPAWAMRANLIEEMRRLHNGNLVGPVGLEDAIKRRYRVGILAGDFNPSAEGYFALSHWCDLPKDDFHLTLITTDDDPKGMELLGRYRADAFMALKCPKTSAEELERAVERIRTAHLDVLIIATNISAALRSPTLLSAHRLARIQIMNTATPVSTGHRAMDCYLSAAFNERPDGQNDYSEELLLLPRSVNFYGYHFDRQRANHHPDRLDLGLPTNKKLIFAGGNFFKLTPALLLLWARIVALCPDSHLVMMPYSPGWQDDTSVPDGILRTMFRGMLEQAGASPDAFTLIPAVATRADRHNIMALCDVYIDSFPFAGACSMLDPLLAGLPVVVRSIPHFRGLLSTAMLRECGLEDMATSDDEAYINRTVRLLQDDQFRAQEAARVQAVRNDGLPFFDTATYGQRLGDVLRDALAVRRQKDQDLLNQPIDRLHEYLVELVQILTRDHNPFFAGLRDDQLMQVMIAGYFANKPDNTTGYMPKYMPKYMIDVGACLGAMAAPLLAQGWQADLFEPDPNCAGTLNKLRLTHHGQVNIYAAVISPVHQEMIDFHQSDTGLSGLGASPYGHADRVIQVPSIRLDRFLIEQNRQKLDFLKIDAEGFDFVALESMGWDDLPGHLWPELILTEFGSNFAQQSPTVIQTGIDAMIARGYGALVFSYEDDGNFAKGVWQHRLIALTTDTPIANKAGVMSGNIIFYRANNSRFLAYLLRQLAGMIHAKDRPDWA